jgi:hypothetical protein
MLCCHDEVLSIGMLFVNGFLIIGFTLNWWQNSRTPGIIDLPSNVSANNILCPTMRAICLSAFLYCFLATFLSFLCLPTACIQ